MKLTKRSIDTFKYEGDGTSRDVRWDDAMPGFGVRIYPSLRIMRSYSFAVDGRNVIFT